MLVAGEEPAVGRPPVQELTRADIPAATSPADADHAEQRGAVPRGAPDHEQIGVPVREQVSLLATGLTLHEAPDLGQDDGLLRSTRQLDELVARHVASETLELQLFGRSWLLGHLRSPGLEVLADVEDLRQGLREEGRREGEGRNGRKRLLLLAALHNNHLATEEPSETLHPAEAVDDRLALPRRKVRILRHLAPSPTKSRGISGYPPVEGWANLPGNKNNLE